MRAFHVRHAVQVAARIDLRLSVAAHPAATRIVPATSQRIDIRTAPGVRWQLNGGGKLSGGVRQGPLPTRIVMRRRAERATAEKVFAPVEVRRALPAAERHSPGARPRLSFARAVRLVETRSTYRDVAERMIHERRRVEERPRPAVSTHQLASLDNASTGAARPTMVVARRDMGANGADRGLPPAAAMAPPVSASRDSASSTPPVVDVRGLTDQIVREIDRRIISFSERHGRFT